jgi:acyl carrier protein
MATTLTPETVEQTIREFLPQLGIAPERITRDASFEQLDVDSLDIIELAEIMEDQHGVELSNDDVAKIKTVGDAIDVIVGHGL